MIDVGLGAIPARILRGRIPKVASVPISKGQHPWVEMKKPRTRVQPGLLMLTRFRGPAGLYLPPKARELEQILGPANFKLLMASPKIKAGVDVWLHATEGKKTKIIRSLAC
jgi:hypothetical protein